MSAGVFFGEMFGGFVQCSGVIFYEINFKGGGLIFTGKCLGALSGVHVRIPMLDHMSLHVEFMICTTTRRQLSTSYILLAEKLGHSECFCHILYKTRPILTKLGVCVLNNFTTVMQMFSTSPRVVSELPCTK